jgi:hypothetical protein
MAKFHKANTGKRFFLPIILGDVFKGAGFKKGSGTLECGNKKPAKCLIFKFSTFRIPKSQSFVLCFQQTFDEPCGCLVYGIQSQWQKLLDEGP